MDSGVPRYSMKTTAGELSLFAKGVIESMGNIIIIIMLFLCYDAYFTPMIITPKKKNKTENQALFISIFHYQYFSSYIIVISYNYFSSLVSLTESRLPSHAEILLD